MTDDALPEEEKALFREHMRAVKPLVTKTIKVKDAPAQVTRPIQKNYPQIRVAKKDYFLSDFISTTVHSDTTLHYAQASLPSKRVRDLRIGAIRWESRLDLHGMKADAAREALCRFIESQFQNSKRCVLIIHGKGGHEGAPPVIKNLVNRWLPQMEEVLAFHSALPKDGGQGAVYVLLKKSGLALSTDYEG